MVVAMYILSWGLSYASLCGSVINIYKCDIQLCYFYHNSQ